MVGSTRAAINSADIQLEIPIEVVTTALPLNPVSISLATTAQAAIK
jgi:hypothetical protein